LGRGEQVVATSGESFSRLEQGRSCRGHASGRAWARVAHHGQSAVGDGDERDRSQAVDPSPPGRPRAGHPSRPGPRSGPPGRAPGAGPGSSDRGCGRHHGPHRAHPCTGDSGPADMARPRFPRGNRGRGARYGYGTGTTMIW
jgi:hypothetical protein